VRANRSGVSVCRRTRSPFAPQQFRQSQPRSARAPSAGNRARFSSLTSSAEYSRYLLSVRRGLVNPKLSHDRMTDGDTPTRRATSPIFK